jgi:hypothetical protein
VLLILIDFIIIRTASVSAVGNNKGRRRRQGRVATAMVGGDDEGGPWV